MSGGPFPKPLILHSAFIVPPPDRPHTAPIPPGLLQSALGRTKEEGGMKNAESRGRLCPATRENHAWPRAIPKPPQYDLKAC